METDLPGSSDWSDAEAEMGVVGRQNQYLGMVVSHFLANTSPGVPLFSFLLGML